MRRRKEMSIGKAMEVLGIQAGDKVTKDSIGNKFRRAAFKIHTDKNKEIGSKAAGERMAELTAAKKVLLEKFDEIPKTTDDEARQPSVGNTFVDYLKTADIKNRKNPFTVYRKGRSK